MFTIYKLYLKWKLTSLIKDRLLHYQKEKYNYAERQNEWINKAYSKSCLSKDQFEQKKKEQIRFSNDRWKEHHYKSEVVTEILHIIEDL